MQRLGQHFLKDPSIAEKIVRALSLAKDDRVIEIGPGRGALTTPLLRAAAKLRADNDGAGDDSKIEVLCIEKDRALVPGIKALGEKELQGRFSVEEGDALKLLPRAAEAMGDAYKLAGNIPYYITGKLLRILGELDAHKPAISVLMVQKEVAERICSVPGDMNRLAASVQFWADTSILVHVPRRDFSPPPEVDSAVIVLRAKRSMPDIEPALYYRAVRALFAQPRKTILNNLEAGLRTVKKKGSKTAVPKETISALLMENDVMPESRPQDLSIEQIIALSKAIPWG